MKFILLLTVGSLAWLGFTGKAPGLPPSAPAQQTGTSAATAPEVPVLTEEQKHQLAELGITPEALTVDVHSPLSNLQKKAERNKKTMDSALLKAAAFRDALRARSLPRDAATCLGLCFVVLFGAWVLRLYSLLRFFSGLCYGLSYFLFVFLALASLWTLFIFRSNLWEYGNFVPLWSSAGLFMLANIGMRLDDENYPFLKTLASGLALPVIQTIILRAGLGFLA